MKLKQLIDKNGICRIPDGTNKIDTEEFKNCNNLAKVIIPNSVCEIGENAFHGCKSLTEVNMPMCVKKLCKGAFSHCINLYKINISCGIKEIEENTFFNCSNLRQIIIPDNVTKICRNSFAQCINLMNIIIPDSVKTVDDNAFSGCINLRRIVCPKHLIDNSDKNDAFVYIGNAYVPADIVIDADSGKSIYDGLKAYISEDGNCILPKCINKIRDNEFLGCENIQNIIIPSNVTKIGKNAFCNCTNLKSVFIPDSVRQIHKNAFYNCSSLKKITCPNHLVGKRFITDDGINMIYLGNAAVLTNIVQGTKEFAQAEAERKAQMDEISLSIYSVISKARGIIAEADALIEKIKNKYFAYPMQNSCLQVPDRCNSRELIGFDKLSNALLKPQPDQSVMTFFSNASSININMSFK